jgi:hypothetical protein
MLRVCPPTTIKRQRSGTNPISGPVVANNPISLDHVKKTYQGTQDKSKQKFLVRGKRKLFVEAPLPMDASSVWRASGGPGQLLQLLTPP